MVVLIRLVKFVIVFVLLHVKVDESAQKLNVHIFVKQEELQQYFNAKQIVINGRGCPKPVFSFEDANFPG